MSGDSGWRVRNADRTVDQIDIQRQTAGAPYATLVEEMDAEATGALAERDASTSRADASSSTARRRGHGDVRPVYVRAGATLVDWKRRGSSAGVRCVGECRKPYATNDIDPDRPWQNAPVPVDRTTDPRRGFKSERAASGSQMPTFTAIGRAAYCPRQLYYARRDGEGGPSADARARQRLAFRYPALRAASDAQLASEPIVPSPPAYREALDDLAGRDDWAALVDPDDTHVSIRGKDCHGRIHKLVGTDDGPVPTLVSPGDPPDRGVWEPQQVRAVGAAKALAWEQKEEPPFALVEYPAHAVVRTVRLTTRAKAAYRRALRAVRSLDGPPPRLRNTTKCRTCAYRDRCGVKTRSMRSLLGR